jgi:ribosomal protein S18 acetylase RimI-like enzyme
VPDIAAAVREAGTVRKATSDEAGQLATVLAHAFYDDPQIAWLVSDESRRMKILDRGFGLFLRKLWFAQDECYTTDGVAGAVVWELPGQWQLGLLAQLRLLPAMAAIYGRFLPRVGRALATLESDHPREQHYYLPFIGVDPEWQGRGIGSALMRPMLERCDREGMPSYLEASSPRNRALYERHGFMVTEEFHLGSGSPPIWRMWRPAGG